MKKFIIILLAGMLTLSLGGPAMAISTGNLVQVGTNAYVLPTDPLSPLGNQHYTDLGVAQDIFNDLPTTTSVTSQLDLLDLGASSWEDVRGAIFGLSSTSQTAWTGWFTTDSAAAPAYTDVNNFRALGNTVRLNAVDNTVVSASTLNHYVQNFGVLSPVSPYEPLDTWGALLTDVIGEIDLSPLQSGGTAVGYLWSLDGSRTGSPGSYVYDYTDLQLEAIVTFSLDGNVLETTFSEVPIPGAIWLLGSGVLGLIGIRRKRR